jgi:HemY protein
VLLTARALELESVDRDLARDSAMEAVKLAPTLVPAAVLASKYQSEAHQIRRSMRIVEAAWLANPHPDLADAYAHVRLGDSARQRLVRVETLAQKTPGHVEGALAVARAAIDASEFARAREVLAPLLAAPTQRVAMLMAEIERTEHGDSGRARAWTLRAVRALHDPVWTADGYVSDRWRPVSPVTGRLDAFQWQAPLAALPSDKGVTVEASAFDEALLAPRRVSPPPAEPPAEIAAEPAPVVAAQDNSPSAVTPTAAPPAPPPEPVSIPAESTVTPAPAEPPTAPATPLFRPRPDLAKGASGAPPVIVPIVRAPDDPGIDDDPLNDEDRERIGPAQGQAGGWRGFLARWSM